MSDATRDEWDERAAGVIAGAVPPGSIAQDKCACLVRAIADALADAHARGRREAAAVLDAEAAECERVSAGADPLGYPLVAEHYGHIARRLRALAAQLTEKTRE